MSPFWLDVTTRLLESRDVGHQVFYDPQAWGNVVAVMAYEPYAIQPQTVFASLPPSIQKLCLTRGRKADVKAMQETAVLTVGRTTA